MKKNKTVGIIIISLIYIVCFIGCYFLYNPIDSLITGKAFEKGLLVIFILDIIATLFIFICSLVFRNSSIYDPYWSLVPIAMIIMYASKMKNLNNLFVIIIIVIISLWGIRLTLNWGYTFKNLSHQDFRYDDLKNKHPKLWFMINLFGVHLVPTIIVFIGMLPAFQYVAKFTEKPMPTLSTWFGACIAVVATIIECVADCQMHHFKKNPQNQGKIINIGLWKNSRHPNYFGEILFWFGICIMGISFYGDNGNTWVLIFSPIIVLLLFVTISIPMMEKRQLANKPGYKEYQEKTNMLIPFIKK